MLNITRLRAVVVFSLLAMLITFGGWRFGRDVEAGARAMFVPTMTSTMTAAPTTDIGSNGPTIVNPGDTLRYTATITNGAAPGAGNDGANAIFSDTLPSTLTLVGSSVKASPIAMNDAFPVTGNVRMTQAAGALTSNDYNPITNNNTTITITTLAGDSTAPFSGTTAQGGNITATTGNGSFEYNPPAGYEGSDSFTYTITDSSSGMTDTGTVTFNVTGMIWFIDQSAAAGGDGRLATPFNCLGGAGCFNAVNDGAGNHPAANDNIFMYRGAGAPAAFTGGVTLLNNQKLFGEGATAALTGAGSLTGLTLAAGSDPLPTTGHAPPVLTTGSLTDNIRLGAGNSNTIRGFTVGDSGTAATGDSADIAGAGIGTLTVSEVTLNGSGRTLNINGGTLNGSFLGVLSNKSTGQGMTLAGVGGTIAMGSTTISGHAIQCIAVSGTTANIDFGNTMCTGGGEGILLSGNSAGTRTFGTLSVTGGSAGAFIHSNNAAIGGGNVTVAGAATLSCAGNVISVSSPASGNLIDFQGATTATTTGAGVTGINWAGAAGATMQFGSLTINRNNGTALNATGGGTITVTSNAGSISNTTAGGPAIVANGIALGANFAAINSTAGASAVSLTNVSGTSNFGAGTLSGSTAATFNISGGSTSVTYAGALTQGNSAPAVNVAAGHTGTLTFQTGTVSATSGTGLQFDNADGTYSFTGTTTLNGGDAGVDILNGSAGTFTFGTNAAITNPTGSAFVVNSAAAPTVTYSGSIIQNNAGRVVDIQATTGGGVTFNTGTVTGGASSLGVHIGDTTAVGGNVTFTTLNLGTAASRMTNQAVTISNGGSAATYALGAATVFTNNAKGIVATNFDGTLNCASTSTVDSSNATAIDIDGPAGLTSLGMTFVSVTSAGGTADGISIQDTNGSFSVVGDGSNTAAGGNSTGGTISAKSGGDGVNSAGIGVFLNNVTNVTLRRVTISGINQNFGIRGLGVNNFTLEYSTVGSPTPTNAGSIAANLQGTSTSGIGEGAIYFGSQTDGVLGLTGTGTFTSNFISSGRYDDMQVSNGGGTLNRLNITNSTFGYNSAALPAANAALTVIARRPGAAGTSTVNSTVTGNTFVGSPGNAANFTGVEPTTTLGVAMDTIFQNNTITNNHANNNIGGCNLTLAGFSSTTFNASNNTMSGANGSAITLQMGAPVAGSTVATSFSGTLNNNTIGTGGVQNSGSASGNGIFLSLADNATLPKGQATIALTNNQIHGYHGNFGISADNTANTNGAYNVDLTITGNVTDTPSPGTSFGGLGLTAGAPPPSANDIDVCAAVTGNDFSNGDPANSNDIIAGGGANGASTLRLPGLVTTTLAGAAAYLKANNLNPATTIVNTYSDIPGGASPFAGGAACATPSTAANMGDENALNSGGGEKLGPEMASASVEAPYAEREVASPLGEMATASIEFSPANIDLGKSLASIEFAPSAAENTTSTLDTLAAAFENVASQISPTVTAQERGVKDVVESPQSAETVCIKGDGTVSGTPCTGPGFTIPAGKTVTIVFDATVAPVGTINPTVFSVSNQGSTSGSNFATTLTDGDPVAAGAQPTVTTIVEPETISKAFSPSSVFPNQQSTLTFTITNANPATAASAITFTDVFPTTPGAMTVATPVTTTNTCGGSLTNNTGGVLTVGDPGIKLTGASRPANTSCTVSVKVAASTSGTYNNTTGAISSFEGAVGLTSNTAPLNVSLLTAAGVSVSGRVLSAEGRGVRGAAVMLTDATGSTRSARTGPGGNYVFNDVPTGQSYTVSVQSKRFTFIPRVITVTDELTGLDFTAEPYQ